jgi:hypothetical protein
MDGLRILVLDDNKLSGTVHRLPPNIEVVGSAQLSSHWVLKIACVSNSLLLLLL